MNRRITMDNCPNLRQLGGYQSSNGGTVKHNRLFRCGTLGNLSDRDIERLSALNLESIIDFRRPSEIEHSPNRLPNTLQDRQRQLNIEPGNLADAFSELSPDRVSQHMVNINKALVLEHQQTYSTFMHQLLELSDGGILFHCTAGKDRTGFAAALILMALDVPREIIYEDYLLTSKYFVPEEQAEHFLQDPHFQEKMSERGATQMVSKNILIPMLEVRREYLQSALDTIDQHFDSESDYLTRALNFGTDKQRQLQALFLD